MKRIVLPPHQRAEAKRRLTNAYMLSHNVSGDVKVRRLAFSNEPGAWSLSSKIITGHPYGTPVEQLRRADVHIHACVSPDWAAPHSKSLSFRDPDTGNFHCILGHHSLPAPAGTDSLELLCTSSDGTSPVLVTNIYQLRFTLGGFSTMIPVGTHHALIARDIQKAHEQFRQAMTKHVAQRLNPPPEINAVTAARQALNQSIDDYLASRRKP